MADKTHSEHATHETHHVPFWILVAVLVVLLILTVLTVAAINFDFGRAMNLWIAMIIATIKAALVVLYFMHVKYDKPIVALILIATLFFTALFIGFALMDSLQYQPAIEDFRAADPQHNYAPELETGSPSTP
jgi:cytochrome c oxidase subunit 4